MDITKENKSIAYTKITAPIEDSGIDEQEQAWEKMINIYNINHPKAIFFGFLTHYSGEIFWYETKEEVAKYKSLKYTQFQKIGNPKPTILPNLTLKKLENLDYDDNKFIWVRKENAFEVNTWLLPINKFI